MTGAVLGCSRGRRRLLVSAVLLVVTLLMTALPSAVLAKLVEGARGAKWFSNPVLGPGQDPSVLTDGGWYYYTQSSPDTKSISIRRSRSIKSLAASVRHLVWHGGRAGSPCCQWWAPELHVINHRWYIYTTADNGTNDNHRLQVLEARTPLGPYTYKGQLTTPGDFWSIDPSPLQLPNGKLFLFWSGWPGTTNGLQEHLRREYEQPVDGV